ncbi:MAG TPA: acyloxyacyl hydrolase [Candidatus Acidoferrales bacterium]|nr:acyloxyacyl hydrolase [Candidatus Acidoferrales bacterium]
MLLAHYRTGRIFSALLLAMLLSAPVARSQRHPEKGGHQIEFWTGGGHGTNGSPSNTTVWNVGARYGWILTEPHGPSFLRGSFEYAVDVVPVFLVFQPANTAYGLGLNPMALKWNLETSGRVMPYLELGGGVLFTNHQVPSGTSRVNFTSGGALGIDILQNRFNWSIELRYLHISNAGLATPNPGINTVQLRLGVGRFTRGRRDDHHRATP